MANLNRVMLMGNLTRDPDMRYTPSGTAVADFGMAVSRRQKGGGEEKLFIDVTAWGRQAEVISEYCTKGRSIFVEGRLKLDTWESDGKKRKKIKVVLEQFQFIGGGKEGEGAPRRKETPDEDAPF